MWRGATRLLLVFLGCSWLGEAQSSEPIPKAPADFLNTYCLECHDADTGKGGVVLEFSEIDWGQAPVRDHWERVLKTLAAGEMPPAKKTQPFDVERDSMVAWLDAQLTRHSPIGGTVVRRLNQAEYRNSIRSIFGIPFELPDGFPPDTERHGFDNIGESLILSPPLLEAYANAAATVADRIILPNRRLAKRETVVVEPVDMAISYSASSLRDGAMRLVTKHDPVMRSCTWPSKFEVHTSGTYRIRMSLSAFKPADDTPLQLQLRAKKVSQSDEAKVPSLRLLHTVEITKQTPADFEFEAELHKGDTIVFYYANAPLDGDRGDKPVYEKMLRAKFKAKPRLLAAWQQVKLGNAVRGGIGWRRIKKHLARDDLDLSRATMDHPDTQKLIKKMLEDPVLYIDTISYEHFEGGPGLDIHRTTIEGPFKIIESPEEKRRRELQAKLIGERGGRSEEAHARDVLKSLLAKVYRKPPTDREVTAFWELMRGHIAAGHTFKEGLHLAIRSMLISPQFLYRALEPGELDAHDLASRLAYFLTSAPPDSELLAKAASGELLQSGELRKQAKRLLAGQASAAFVEHFVGQWLDTRKLEHLMPDERFNVGQADLRLAKRESEQFFRAMLKENRPMTDFIDPDFTFTTKAVATKVYGIGEGLKDSDVLQRVALQRGGRYGGVLGQAAVLAATANGVHTQPVVRGVWVLENILGDSPPPPPDAVPAITPDTTGAKTVREQLKAHTADTSCNVCHKKIDPIGFAFENFDPVGRWRERYPIFTKNEKGQRVVEEGNPVDPTGQLRDGTKINDFLDLKKWVVGNIGSFSECLSEKLLVYATGRPLSYAERKEITRLVQENQLSQNRFEDLLLALIDSRVFRTK
jgi:hypothetical protein